MNADRLSIAAPEPLYAFLARSVKRRMWVLPIIGLGIWPSWIRKGHRV